jgi:hypothetical protein
VKSIMNMLIKYKMVVPRKWVKIMSVGIVYTTRDDYARK